MLRIISRRQTRTGPAGLERYLSERGKAPGVWGGKAGEWLGVEGSVEPSDFVALAMNRDPLTDERLTLRTKANRRMGYDFNFNPSKTVSIVYALTKDQRIRAAVEQAAEDTMREIERRAMTRVRTDGFQDTDRPTGNMVWARYTHFTTRPIGGVPDPHLHCHCMVFNVTYDDVEKRFKALQVAGIKKDGACYQAVFHSRLAHHLEALGYRTFRKGFAVEIAGVPEPVMRCFSQRTTLIRAEAKARGITSPSAQATIGMQTREPKRPGLSEADLDAFWAKAVSPEDRLAVLSLQQSSPSEPPLRPDPAYVEHALNYAKEKCFERMSVVTPAQLLEAAVLFSMGKLELETLRRALDADRTLIHRTDKYGQTVVTTPEIVEEERKAVRWVCAGRGGSPPLAAHLAPSPTSCSEIDLAVRHVLTSQDRVIAIHGKSGTGKTTLLRQAVPAIIAGGYAVVTLAPSASASRGTLHEAGFTGADTLEKFLITQREQDKARGGVIWVDEAGQISMGDMARLFRCADQLEARVVLSGDTRQHRAVDRGDAYRTLIEHAELPVATLSDIKRQRGLYKQAIDHLSEHRVFEAFQLFDAMGAIVEGAPLDLHAQLAREYIEARKNGERVHIVSPTHAEGRVVTATLREHLNDQGEITGEQNVTIFRRLDLYKADRRKAENYQPGWVLECTSGVSTHFKGDRVLITAVEAEGLVVQSPKGREFRINPDKVGMNFRAYQRDTIPVGIGDRIRITKNGYTQDRSRLHNSAVHTVTGFTPDGDMILDNGKTLSKHYAHIDHGWCTTSYAAQSMSVDRVFVAETRESFGAANREQMYVSASRGKLGLKIFTECKHDLFEAVQRSSQRTAALDLEIDEAPAQSHLTRGVAAHKLPNATLEALHAAIAARSQVNHDLDLDLWPGMG